MGRASHVYVASLVMDGVPCLKVGMTRDIEARLLAIAQSTGQQMSFVGAVPNGGRTLESEAIEMLNPWLMQGREWFEDVPETRAIIEAMIVTEEMPPPVHRTVRSTFCFPESMHRQMRRAAAEEGKRRGAPVSVAEWMRGVVEDALAVSR